MKIKKLELKKKVITSLSNADQQKVIGGYTTSNSDCTHFLCCNNDCAPPPPKTTFVQGCPDPSCKPIQ